MFPRFPSNDKLQGAGAQPVLRGQLGVGHSCGFIVSDRADDIFGDFGRMVAFAGRGDDLRCLSSGVRPSLSFNDSTGCAWVNPKFDRDASPGLAVLESMSDFLSNRLRYFGVTVKASARKGFRLGSLTRPVLV